MAVETLALFDFDGTLFRSPSPPPGWKGGWWGRPESLRPPHVPMVPGPEWWHSDVVVAARRAAADSGTVAVLATGRPAPLRPRILELLSIAGLSGLSGVYTLGGGGEKALERKVELVEEILVSHPGVRRAEVWDDRDAHLRVLVDVLRTVWGLSVRSHLVDSQ